MKKTLLILAAAATLAVSCTNAQLQSRIDALEVRGHLPNEQISGLYGLWFSVQCKVHSPGFAEKVDVVISVEIVRFERI